MRRRNRVNPPVWLQIIIIVLALAGLAGMLFVDHYESQKREAYLSQLQQWDRERKTPQDDNSINFDEPSGFRTVLPDGGKKVLAENEFAAIYSRTSYYSGTTRISADLSNLKLSDAKIYLLRFKMKASDKAAIVEVNFGDSYDVYVTTEWSEYYYPCLMNKVTSVSWVLESEFQIVEMSDVEIYEYDSDVDLQKFNCGVYLAEDRETTLSEDTDLHVGSKNRDVQYMDGYVYLVGDSSLFIAKENSEGVLSVCGYLTDLGEVRRIELYDNSMLAVASRLNGVYLIDISDKEHPSVISHYNTLEIANDICFSGQYMFVAGRYFGVEIVDISDKKNPEFVTQIMNERECYRVAVQDHILFVSCWDARKVELYDISTVNDPRLIKSIQVDGRCGEVFVSENYMYVVTGYGAANMNESVGQPGYGTGNGLEIYDITDKNNPQWLSTVKADGSLFHSGFDDWSVNVSNDIAYFTNSYGGLYVYDVSDPVAPKRIRKYTVPLYRGVSSQYVDMSESDDYVFPYDCTEYINSPVTGVALGNGRIYFSCAYTTLHSLEFENARPIDINSETDTEYILNEKGKTNRYNNVEYLLQDQNVYVIKEIGDCYYVGTDLGIIVLNKFLQIIGTVNTDDAVRDIQVSGMFLFTAETTGMGIYQIGQEGACERIGFYNSNVSDKHVSSLGITPDRKFAILQASWTNLDIVSITDMTNPVQVDTLLDPEGNRISLNDIEIGTLYYRNIVNGDTEGMVGVIGTTDSAWFKSLGEDLQMVTSYYNSLYREYGGTASLENGQVISICDNGYKVYNPLEEDEESLLDIAVNKIQDVSMSGKATVSGNTLIVCHEYKGYIWVVDIEDINNPMLEGYYEISGNPDLCLVTDDYILIPARHSGLMKIAR